MSAPRVLALVGELDGCHLWRILQPFTELQKQGYTAEWGYRDDDRLGKIVHRFDAVILPRLHWPPEEKANADRWFDALHDAGKAIIYEVDDDLMSDDLVRRLVVLHQHSQRTAEQIRSAVLYTMGRADGVTVSSQRLATIVRSYTDKPVAVVPNYIDLPWFQAVQAQAERKVDSLCIGWAGGLRPDADVEMMAQAWQRTCERFPQVTFLVQGHQAAAITERIPESRRVAVDWLPIHAYPIGLKNIDIGCCPLTNTPFNRAKTPIKSMEYAASGAAVVASPIIYSQIIHDGLDGYLCESVDQWETALATLVQSADVRQRLAQRLLTNVKKSHTLQKNVWRWPYAWSQIVDDYHRRQPRKRVVVPHWTTRKNSCATQSSS